MIVERRHHHGLEKRHGERYGGEARHRPQIPQPSPVDEREDSCHDQAEHDGVERGRDEPVAYPGEKGLGRDPEREIDAIPRKRCRQGSQRRDQHERGTESAAHGENRPNEPPHGVAQSRAVARRPEVKKRADLRERPKEK